MLAVSLNGNFVRTPKHGKVNGQNIDGDFGELSGVGVCFCIGGDSIRGVYLCSSEKHRRGSSMGYSSIVSPSLCFRIHADLPITHYIRVDSPIRTNLRNLFISAEKLVLMRGVLFASFVIEMAATFRSSSEDNANIFCTSFTFLAVSEGV